MPNLDILNFLRSGQYPMARASAPGNGLNLLLNGIPNTSTTGGGVVTSPAWDAQKPMAPGVEMPGFNQYGGIGNKPYGPPIPKKGKGGGGGLMGMLAALMGGAGGTQANPVVDQIKKQMGILQSQAGASRADLLNHEKMAKGDLGVLYNHLNNYIANQRGQNNQDFRDTIRANNRTFGQGAAQTNQAYNQAAKAAAAEDQRLGITGVGTQGIRANQAGQVSRIAGDRADLNADSRSQRNNWNAVSRQMQADSKMEGTVQVGQVHRDTTKALGALANTLQSQLGQLQMAKAQAQASGQSNPLDILGKELDLKKKLIDIKAAQKKLSGGGSGGSGSAKQGFQMALQYLGDKGGQYSKSMQNLLNSAQLQLDVPHGAGSGTDLSKFVVKGANGQQMPDYWDASNIAGLMQWFNQQTGKTGGNMGQGPMTPQESAMLQRALRIAFKQDQ